MTINEEDARQRIDEEDTRQRMEMKYSAERRLARLEASERLVSSISEGTSEQALDEAVHDGKSREASIIINEGWQSQIDFLLDAGYSEEELREMLKGC